MRLFRCACHSGLSYLRSPSDIASGAPAPKSGGKVDASVFKDILELLCVIRDFKESSKRLEKEVASRRHKELCAFIFKRFFQVAKRLVRCREATCPVSRSDLSITWCPLSVQNGSFRPVF